jgi:hypothetical protein
MSSDIKFLSGRYIEAGMGVVGISPDLEFYEGFNGAVDWPPLEGWAAEGNELTADDMRELADMMIERWQRFKETLDKEQAT